MRKRSDLRAVPPPSTTSDHAVPLHEYAGALHECFLHGPYESEECPTCGTAVSQPPKDPEPAPIPLKGAFCSICALPQMRSQGGLTCANGHGGADTFSAAEAEELRKAVAAGAREVVVDHGPARGADTWKLPLDASASVAATSTNLKDAISEEQDKEEKATNPLAWGGEDRPSVVPVDPAFEAIVSTIFIDDPAATYKRLEKALVVGDKRTDYGSMMRHLDEAEMNAREAHKLLQTGVRSLKGWEADNQVVWAGMRTQATRSLQKEKDDKLRSKQITDEDVESRMAAIYPDEYKEQRAGHAKMKAMVHSLENLAELWSSRCRTLQVLLGKQR